MAISVARGDPWVGPDHLLEALLADPTNTAGLLVEAQMVDLDRLTRVARRTWPVAGGKPPIRNLADHLARAGALVDPAHPGLQRSTALTRGLTSGIVRLAAQASPALAFLEQEATAEAVRLGHDRTTLVHLILAVLVLEEQLTSTGLRPSGEYAVSCDFVLRPFGMTRSEVFVSLADVPQEGAIAAPQRRRSWRSSPKNPPWTLPACQAGDTARTLAANGKKSPGGSADLLLAVLSHPDDAGRRLLREHSVDPSAVEELLARRLEL
ncbi:Clp protease N-terminal domain-containing protein [Actinoplanes sp. SE50/110]|uniref:Clp protease N-terminal domain-containing protein n=1 Tax=unclassified Actinoplanes TaxID=2626549 RepID=UPI003510B35F